MNAEINPSWIAVDWGTSHLRAWAMDTSGAVLAHAQSNDGMGKLKPDQFEAALLKLIEPWLGDDTILAVACGMVGARQGWVEANYVPVPCKPDQAMMTAAPVTDPRIAVHILPGVSQDTPADVMRGEETQILGALAEMPNFDGVICLPGTHTKWVRISAEEIVSFQTVMTGEVFALLSDQSVLRHSVAGDDFDQDCFDEGVFDAMSHPEKLTQRFFAIRAQGLLHGQSNAEARGRLSGLLIGAELAACRPYWLGQDVLICGAPQISALYGRALAAQGVSARLRDGDDLTLGGLRRAYQSIAGGPQ